MGTRDIDRSRKNARIDGDKRWWLGDIDGKSKRERICNKDECKFVTMNLDTMVRDEKRKQKTNRKVKKPTTKKKTGRKCK